MIAIHVPLLPLINRMAGRQRVTVAWLLAEAHAGRVPCLRVGTRFLLAPEAAERLRTGRAARERETPRWLTTRQWDLVFELIDALVVRWPEKRALAVTGAVRDWTQEQIGQLWKPAIEQSTVNMHLKGAGWISVKRGVEEFQMYWDAYDGK